MALVFHVISAFASLIVATYVAAVPSVGKLRVSGFLVGVAVVSGVAVGVEYGVPLARACISGLLYLAFIGACMYLAIRRLATTSTLR